MSEIIKCSLCSLPAFKICRCENSIYLCPEHLSLHVISDSRNHAQEHFYHPIFEYHLKILEKIKQKLENNLHEEINTILDKRQKDLESLFNNIKEIEIKYESKIMRLIEKENTKMEEIKQMIKEKRIISVKGSERLEKLKHRVEETFEETLKRLYLKGMLREKVKDWILVGHSDRVECVALSTNGKLLASGSRDNTIALWKIPNLEPFKILEGHSHSVYSVDFSEDGELLASGSYDKTIILWKVSTGEFLKTLKGHISTVSSVVFSKDRKYLASGYWDKQIALWEVSNGKRIRILNEHSNCVTSVAFSEDGKYLASGSKDKTICLWRVSTGELIKRLEGHSNWVRSVTFSKDGKYLASGSLDGTIGLWEVSSGERIKTLSEDFNRVISVLFSSDGKYLVSVSYSKILLWKVESGECIKRLKTNSFSNSVAISRKGGYLASGFEDSTIVLLRVFY